MYNLAFSFSIPVGPPRLRSTSAKHTRRPRVPAVTSTAAASPDLATLKKNLLSTIADAKASQRFSARDSPVTPVNLRPDLEASILAAVSSLEAAAPVPRPLVDQDTLPLVDGCWLLRYSNSSEITALAKLPPGLRVTRVEQNIDLPARRFENYGFVDGLVGLASGYVRVSAAFSPAIPSKRNAAAARIMATSDSLAYKLGRRVTVQFQYREVCVRKFLWFVPVPRLLGKILNQDIRGNGKVPFLDLTYLDKDIRIGRGGKALFVLERAESKAP